MNNPLAPFYAKLSKKEKSILFFTLFFLSITFVDRVIVLPLATSMSALSQSVRDQETAIKKSLSVLLHKDSIIAENRDYMAYSLEAKNPEDEMVGLLKEVELEANKAGVNLLYVKPGTMAEEKNIKKYYSTLECEATMEQVATFFHGIESSTKLLKIEKYQIQPKSKNSSIARCAVTVYKAVLSSERVS
jgi:hypothetical protein